MSELFVNDIVSYPIGLEMEFANSSLEERRDSDGNMSLQMVPMSDPTARAATGEFLPKHLLRTGLNPTPREYTSDGARYYIDHCHFETARPMATTIREAVTQFIVGQEVAYEAFATMKKAGRLRDFILSLRLVDTVGNSWGYHENYLMRRDTIHDVGEISRDWEKLWPLSMRLATSALSGGAGCIFDGKYSYSQKALTLGADVASATTSDKPLTGKPLFNTRDNPHANRNKYFRMHVVSRDALIDPVAHFRELGITSLVIAALEAKIPMRDMRPRGPKFGLAKMIAGDMSMQRTVTLQSGSVVHPNNIDEELINAARMLSDRYELSEELQLALAMWESVHTRRKAVVASGKGINDPLEAQEAVHEAACRLMPDVVWARRLSVLRGDRLKNSGAYSAEEQGANLFKAARAVQLDQGFDRIDDPLNPKASIGMKLRLLPQAAAFMPGRKEIDEAKYGLPKMPRERQRAEFIRTFPNNDAAHLNWEAVSIGHTRFGLSEPREENRMLTDYLENTERARKVA